MLSGNYQEGDKKEINILLRDYESKYGIPSPESQPADTKASFFKNKHKPETKPASKKPNGDTKFDSSGKPIPTSDVNPAPKTDSKNKIQLSHEGRQSGDTLALRLHQEIITGGKSLLGDGKTGKIEEIFLQVNKENAYTFFKTYTEFAKEDKNIMTTGAVHDSYRKDNEMTLNISTIDPLKVKNAITALLNQAESFGLYKSQSYIRLTSYASMINDKDNISSQFGNQIDGAIRQLIKEMDTKVA